MLNKGWFTETYDIVAQFEAGVGLKSGTEVQVNGIRVGKIKRLILAESGNVQAILEIENNYAHHITTSSVAYPTRDKNIISDRVIMIEHGFEGRQLTPLDTIHSETPKDIETLLTQTRELLDKVQFLVHAGDTLIRMARDTNSTIGQLLTSNKMHVSIMKQLNTFDGITKRSAKLLDTLNTHTPNLFSQVDTINQTILGLTQRSTKTFNQVDTLLSNSILLTQSIQPVLWHAQDLIEGSESKMEKADEIMNSIGDLWILGDTFIDKSQGKYLIQESW